MDIIQKLSQELGLKKEQVTNAVQMIDEGSTIPFIARYRKEQTGEMDDVQLRQLDERLKYLRNLEARKEEVIRIITEQEKLTADLEKDIQAAETLQRVEDLYLPYKQKKSTRATKAKEKGLEPLAELIWSQTPGCVIDAAAYINEDLGVLTAEEALAGAMDIMAEKVSDNANYREVIRKQMMKDGLVVTKAVDESAETVYKMYYNYQEPVHKIVNHRILAINRGEKEKALKVKIDYDESPTIAYLKKDIIKGSHPEAAGYIELAIEDGYKRLIQPSIEREIRNMLTERAEEMGIQVFAKNLKPLLMQPPIKDKVCLACDPGFAHGCKVAVVDGTGKFLENTIIYPVEPHKKTEQAKRTLKTLVEKYEVEMIAIGNGTASRETEQFIADFIKTVDRPIYYIIVNEAGASVYSASKLATEEYPELDVETRGAISIGRRLQDPLAELVKIDPKSIGVGQYQHDVDQKKLGESLGIVVEDCVNTVGVDLNTASPSLLNYISGINKTTAKNIVDYREENGKFKNRKELLKVKRLGAKVYEQCAGFLRIVDGDNILDTTSVHPESYKVTEKLLKLLKFTDADVKSGKTKDIDGAILAYGDQGLEGNLKAMAEILEVGYPTLRDIVAELKKPGRDPRDEMPKPVLRSDILSLKDLEVGMILRGTVRNVVDFGAFVDIGVHDDGLVHISELVDRYIKHPLEVVSVGDVVEVKIIDLDVKRRRIALTMKNV